MISQNDKLKIQDLVEKYKVKKVILFGSGCDPEIESHDIDLAAEGVEPAQFFKFYGELLFSLSKPVDIVDLNYKNRFQNITLLPDSDTPSVSPQISPENRY